MITRRRFLQVGLAGTVVLGMAGMLVRSRADVIAPLVPVVLDSALPPTAGARAAAVHEVAAAFHRAIGGLAPAVQEEVGELLALLQFAPTRYAFTGLVSPLAESSEAQIASFLARWRESRFDLLRAGYQALTQLIQAAWYDNPASWPTIGYPGPPGLAPR